MYIPVTGMVHELNDSYSEVTCRYMKCYFSNQRVHKIMYKLLK